MTTELRRLKLEKAYYSIDVDRDGVIDELDVTALAQIWCDTYDLEPRSEDWRRIHFHAHKLFRGMPGKTDGEGVKRVTVEDWVAWGDDPAFPAFVEDAAIPFSIAVFTAADKDRDGRITAPEMMAAQIRGGMSEEETTQAFGMLDTDGDGYVTTQEYVEAARAFYLSDDPDEPGNSIAGDL
ncbi:EF-hand domain-containing protein [Saccharothrix sp. NRRL B-16314]|uniref:EF-hand domain-containing protein n=1 Tax=Saccharothrix sp. NRRL B-16314 TaxID=1463825 RepID=UPI0005261A10|nr:EF-hand domain-containing protein [Saccharothrix sp. NRRL B-16314]